MPNRIIIGGAGTGVPLVVLWWPEVVIPEVLVTLPELDEEVDEEPDEDVELLVEVELVTLPEVEVLVDTLPEVDDEVE